MGNLLDGKLGCYEDLRNGWLRLGGVYVNAMWSLVGSCVGKFLENFGGSSAGNYCKRGIRIKLSGLGF